MIPNETLQTVDTLGNTSEVGNFRIEDHTQARILMSLSDKMYTRKELAVVREYSTNAADAHVSIDKDIANVVVTLPTLEDLNFRIRDFGNGLTEAEIRNIYCVFGESTKRNSNKLNGVLGYGCKAGFAHADSFTVTSWVNGQKTVYQCIKGDSTRLHSSIRLTQEPSDEPNGIEVCVPVKQSSWYTFHREAANFYRNWPIMPVIKNMSEDDMESLNRWRNTPATLKGEGWEVRPKVDGNASAVAYMGYVPYQIDWNVLYHKMSLDSKTRALFDLLRSNDVILYFSMGEINFVDSREHLEYTDKTVDALISRVKEIFVKIKDSIQEKFTGLSNLWEAKMMYNSIFGTGIIEVEKGESELGADTATRIKILDGNLMALENTFKDAFSWNGITLDGPGWYDLNRFDNAAPTELQGVSHFPSIPVLVTYRKKKNRVKSNRCTDEKAERIMASNQTVVVINDTGRKSGQQMAARYLIFGHEKHYQTVYVLTFEQQSLKDLFFKEMHFDSVPVLYLSNLMPEAKTWNNANKVHRNYGGGGSGARPMRYIDLESGTIEESEVPVQDIEDGGFFVEAAVSSRRSRGRDRTHIVGKHWMHYEVDDTIEAFKTVCEQLDLDVDRIYIINAKTADSKWFLQAKASGEWTLIWKAIDEALPNFSMDINHLVDAENYENTTKVCEEAAKMLVPMIMDKNSPILKLISTVSEKNFDECVKIKNAFVAIGYWGELKGKHTGTIDFDTAERAVSESYPYLPWNDLTWSSNVTEVSMTRIAKYINSMDLYVDLTRDTTPKPVESEAVAA